MVGCGEQKEQEARVAAQYTSRMEEEAKRVGEAETMIKSMEAEEEALIERLRTTQVCGSR